MEAKYNPLNLDEHEVGSSSGMMSNEHADYRPSKSSTFTRKPLLWLTLFNIFLFFFSSIILVCSIFSSKQPATVINQSLPSTSPMTASLMDQYNIYSPAADAVSYQHVQFHVPNPLNSSEYVGANPDVDKAWDRITFDIGDQMVTKEGLKRLGKPEDSLKVTDPRTGIEGYRIGVEVFHQLHCLNLLRKTVYMDYYQDLGGDFDDPIPVYMAHMDHCIEMLRLNLMCFADVNVFTFHEVPGLEGPWPDYNTHHVCRNFEAVRDWAVQNTVATDNI